VSRIQLPESWSDISSSEAGFCYLSVFTSEVAQKAAYTLGPYPTWGEVCSFGSFSRGTFHVRRQRGKVHIGTSGAGVPAHKLDIRSHEVVGVVDTGFEPWKSLAWIFPLYLFPLLTLTVCLCWNHTYLVEAVGGRHPFGPKKPRTISTVGKAPMILMLLVANLTLSSAALTFRLENVINSLGVVPTTVETSMLASVHHRYTRGRKRDMLTSICLDNNPLMVEILDLDIRDELLEAYISTMCVGMADTWRNDVETRIIKEGLIDYLEYFQVAKEAVDDTLDRVAGMTVRALDGSVGVVSVLTADLLDASREVKDVADRLVETVLTDLPEDVARLGEAAVVVVKEVALAPVNLADSLVQEIPAGLKEVEDVVKETIKLIPKPSTLITELSGLAPTTDQVFEVASEGVEILTTAASDVVSGSYGQMKDVVVDNFKSLGEKDFVDVVSNAWAKIFEVKDITMGEVSPRLKIVVDEMPAISYDLSKAAGSLIGGVLEGAGLAGDAEKTLQWKVLDTMLGSRETKEQRSKRLDHEAYLKNHGRKKFSFSFLTRPDTVVREMSTASACLITFIFICFFIWDITARYRI
jgi:hypothetical protein